VAEARLRAGVCDNNDRAGHSLILVPAANVSAP
jgi:hypothetical protein